MNKKFTSFLILLAGFTAAMTIVRVQTFAASKPYIALERDSSSGLFTLTVSDPNGIKEFSLLPKDKSPYGGELGNCATVFKSDNIGYFSPDQFTPKMDATILDCQGNTISIELPPIKNGTTRGTVVSAPQTQTVTLSAGEQKASSEKKPKSSILANIQFPVKELGNCQSEVECAAYCDTVDHATACLDFAQKHNLLTPDEIKQKEKLASIGTGPGGCKSQASCETYCNDVVHIDECVAFGESHNLLTGKDLEDAKKIQSAIGAGKKLPGGCTGKKSCESYCNDADHADECLAFAEDSGFLSQQEIQQYKTFSDFRKKGETPGGCTTKASCEAYCENSDNMEECLSFGEKTGFVSGEDAAMARKVLPLIKEGKTPGKCKTKDQCEAYCASEDHADECINFGLQAGMISSQDAEIIKKTGGKGPGGCRGKEQCRAYCEQNQQECMDWAKANGLEGQFSGPGGCKNQEECIAYCKVNQEDETCKKMMQNFGGGSGFQGGQGEEHGQGFQGGQGGNNSGFSGPGGCKSKEECMAYCKDHPDECKNFAPPGGGFPGGHGGFPGGIPRGEKYVGPGGCATPDECIRYCKLPENKEECDNFQTKEQPPGPSQGRGPGGCSSVEECVKYCHGQNSKECDAFTNEGGDEVKCQPGWEIKKDNQGYRYCSPKSCPEGTNFVVTDKFGRQACSPSGQNYGGNGQQAVPSSSTNIPSQNENPQQILPQSFPQIPPTSNQSPQDYCSSFASVPSCSYVGSPDSQNYQYCKQCFPDK